MDTRTHGSRTQWQIAAVFFLLLVMPRLGWPQSDGLHKLFSDYYEFQLREDPGTATFVGRSDYNDRWDDTSPEHLRQRRQSRAQTRQGAPPKRKWVPPADHPWREAARRGAQQRAAKEAAVAARASLAWPCASP